MVQLGQEPGTTVLVIEPDGHETRFSQTSDSKFVYLAPGHGDGTPYLRYRPENTSRPWERYCPGTQMSEYYDGRGLLRERLDIRGNVSRFTYDEQGLAEIHGPSGNTYQIKWSKDNSNNICAIFQTIGGDSSQLQTYVFDERGRLLQSITLPFKNRLKEAYITTYRYSADTSWLTTIDQADTSHFEFYFKPCGDTRRIDRLCPGLKVSNGVDFNYISANVIEIQSRDHGVLHLVLNEQGRLQEITQKNLYFKESTVVDKTSYTYSENGQLSTITHPNGAIERFTHDNFYGFKTEHVSADGFVTRWSYPVNWAKPRCTFKEQFSPSGSANPFYLLTRYVYKVFVDGYGRECSFLRFVISPENRVTEYQVDLIGQVLFKRCYMEGLFTVVAKEPSAMALEEWAKSQPPQDITLTGFDYDYRGQVQKIWSYTDIDEAGNGLPNEQMGQEIFDRDEAGNWYRHVVQIGQKQSAVTRRQHDEFERLIEETDALGSKSQRAYLDKQNQHVISQTLINGDICQTKENFYQFDDKGLLTNKKLSVNEKDKQASLNKIETRETQYSFDLGGHPVLTTLPDGRYNWQFWDLLQRPILSVLATRQAKLTLYDNSHSYQVVIQPAQPADSTILNPNNYHSVLKVREAYLNVLKLAEASATRYFYTFYDKCDRVRYTVDEENYVVETIYDGLGRLIGTVQYADKVRDDELTALKNQQSLTRVIDLNRDRWHSSYYDKDGLLIGEIDPEGWVKAYRRDAGGRIVQTILYATPQKTQDRNSDFEKVRPEKSLNDAITYHFYNARNQIICEVNANGFITETDYYRNALIKQKTVCYTKVDANWYDQPTRKPTPVPHLEDAIETFSYNAKGQLLTHEHSNGEKIAKQYDSWGQCVSEKTYDQSIVAHPEKSADPDYARSHQRQYDGWQQTTRETNAYISQQMLLIEANGQLSPVEKQAKLSELWQERSIRRTYDPASGLLCQMTNSLNHVTRYYYDQERRLTVTIDALGQVIQHDFNLFGEITSTRHYIHPIAADTLAGLTGGFIDDAVLALLVKSEQDPVETYTYDKRGSLTSHTDAEGYIHRYQVNAFKEVIAEQLPVEVKEPSLTISHRFNANGQEIETVHQADNLLVRTTQAFDNPYGHVTKQIDAENSVTVLAYDARGNPISRTDNDVVVYQNQCFDALNRVLTSQDAFQAETQHVYNQATRNHHVNLPVDGDFFTNQTNVFSETVCQTDAKGHAKTQQHEPDGQVRVQCDEIGRTIVDEHNSEGWHKTHLSATGVKTAYHYNALGVLTQTVANSDSSASRSTQIGLDTLYRQATITNPLGTVSRNTFDRRGLILTSQIDPDGLKLLVSYQ